MTLRQLVHRQTEARAKWTEATIAVRLRIVQEYRDGKTPSQLAEECGVTRQHIHNIITLYL